MASDQKHDAPVPTVGEAIHNAGDAVGDGAGAVGGAVSDIGGAAGHAAGDVTGTVGDVASGVGGAVGEEVRVGRPGQRARAHGEERHAEREDVALRPVVSRAARALRCDPALVKQLG